LTPGFALLAVLLSVLLGGLHAFAPGHGKTLMAAYLVGRQGTWRQAAVIGLSVTLTHTAGVLLLGVALSAAVIAAPERVYPWLGVLSGLMLAGIGITLFRAARGRGRPGAPGAHVHGPGGHTHGPAVRLVSVGSAHQHDQSNLRDQQLDDHPHDDHQRDHHLHDDHQHEDHQHEDHPHDHAGHPHDDHPHDHQHDDADRQHDHAHDPAAHEATHTASAQAVRSTTRCWCCSAASRWAGRGSVRCWCSSTASAWPAPWSAPDCSSSSPATRSTPGARAARLGRRVARSRSSSA
jgi:nickel/cobalt exporter